MSYDAAPQSRSYFLEALSWQVWQVGLFAFSLCSFSGARGWAGSRRGKLSRALRFTIKDGKTPSDRSDHRAKPAKSASTWRFSRVDNLGASARSRLRRQAPFRAGASQFDSGPELDRSLPVHFNWLTAA